MQAYKVFVNIPDTRRIELVLPDDAPPGPAEVIILIPRANPPVLIPWPFVRRRTKETPAAAHPASEVVPRRIRQRAC
jgi:hypothetical protein